MTTYSRIKSSLAFQTAGTAIKASRQGCREIHDKNDVARNDHRPVRPSPCRRLGQDCLFLADVRRLLKAQLLPLNFCPHLVTDTDASKEFEFAPSRYRGDCVNNYKPHRITTSPQVHCKASICSRKIIAVDEPLQLKPRMYHSIVPSTSVCEMTPRKSG